MFYHVLLFTNMFRSLLPQSSGCHKMQTIYKHEIIWNVNLMQHGNFINLLLARYVSGTYDHHQEH